MYNHLIGTYEAYGYDITVRRSDINGMYQLSTMATSMGEEYRVAKQYDTFNEETTLKDFVSYVEATK